MIFEILSNLKQPIIISMNSTRESKVDSPVTEQIKEDNDDLDDLVSLVRDSDNDQSNNLFSALAPQQREPEEKGKMVSSISNMLKDFRENSPIFKGENKDSMISTLDNFTKITELVGEEEYEKLNQQLDSSLKEFLAKGLLEGSPVFKITNREDLMISLINITTKVTNEVIDGKEQVD